MKKLLLLTAVAGIIGLPALSQAQERATVYDGSTYRYQYGTTLTHLPNEGRPDENDMVNGAVNFTSGEWSQAAWSLDALSDVASPVAPISVDWSNGALQFDYKVDGGVHRYYSVSLQLYHNGANISIGAITLGGAGEQLTADGQWHTAEVQFSGYAPEYLTLLEDPTFDPTLPTLWKFRIQPGLGGMTNVLIDNVTVPVPEPATYAALAGALALGVVLLRRRK